MTDTTNVLRLTLVEWKSFIAYGTLGANMDEASGLSKRMLAIQSLMLAYELRPTYVMKAIRGTTTSIRHFFLDFKFTWLSSSSSPSQPIALDAGFPSTCSSRTNEVCGDRVGGGCDGGEVPKLLSHMSISGIFLVD